MNGITSFVNLLNQQNINHTLSEPMFKHTTFKTGGCADVFIEVKNISELKYVINSARKLKIPFFVIGRGSNMLVSDQGVSGAVITLGALNSVEVQGNIIRCGAGASLTAVCIAARDAALTGLEFAYGIPGTAGGAMYMNAGAYGGEMSAAVQSVTALDEQGNVITLLKEDMQLGYRTSIFKSKKHIVTEVVFELSKGDKTEISAAMEDLMSRRREKQPLNFPSAGSTFKRPEGHFAGALIEKSGLKGYSIGGAKVSELHAGFIINFNCATTEDILKLIRHVQKTVFENDGILLEPEVLCVGNTAIHPYSVAEEITKD